MLVVPCLCKLQVLASHTTTVKQPSQLEHQRALLQQDQLIATLHKA